MLINLTNHPSSKWSKEQMDAAIHEFGGVDDYPFPNIDPSMSKDAIREMANELADYLRPQSRAVLVQGEMCFTHHFITIFQTIYGGLCYHACSERDVIHEVSKDGSTKKLVSFKFVQFRRY